MRCALLLMICCTTLAAVEATVPEETIPEGVTPDAEQQALFHELAAKFHYASAVYDAEGTVVHVVFGNHQGRIEKMGDRPGFASGDLARFTAFTGLRGISFEHVGAPTDDYAVFRGMPQLEYVNISNPDWKERIPGDYLVHFDDCRQLKELILYHHFGHEAPWDQMRGFPELKRFAGERELSSGDEAVDFLAHSPELEFLDLQRSQLSDEQVETLMRQHPELRVVKWKPHRGFEPRHLRHLQLLPELRYFTLEFKGALPMPFEDGLEHLVPIAGLERIHFNFSDEEMAGQVGDEDLREARADLLMSNGWCGYGLEPGKRAPYPLYVDFLPETNKAVFHERWRLQPAPAE